MTLFSLKILLISSISSGEQHPLNRQHCLRTKKYMAEIHGSAESVSYKQGMCSANWGSFISWSPECNGPYSLKNCSLAWRDIKHSSFLWQFGEGI